MLRLPTANQPVYQLPLSNIKSKRRSKKDIETAETPREYLEGFAEFSEFISCDSENLIYRRFGSLGARNLLYLQAELQLLEAQLRDFDKRDKQLLSLDGSEDEKKAVDDAARAWECFLEQSVSKDGQRRKMALVLELRQVMKEYGISASPLPPLPPLQERTFTPNTEEALLRRSRILALPPPSTGTLRAFTNWFRHKKPFRGSAWHVLDDKSDMLALAADAEPDRLSELIRHYLGYRLRETRSDQPRSWGPVYFYPARRVARIVAGLSVLIAVLLLVGAIVALYYEPRMAMKIGLLALFTVMFGVSVGLLTKTRRVEVFAATAA
jgi:hypothetical protein